MIDESATDLLVFFQSKELTGVAKLIAIIETVEGAEVANNSSATRALKLIEPRKAAPLYLGMFSKRTPLEQLLDKQQTFDSLSPEEVRELDEYCDELAGVISAVLRKDFVDIDEKTK